MFTHAQVWHGIDRLARENGLTASGLARRAGLDPTTFNPSKRITKEDKPRWPSTESLAKILNATETPFPLFVAMMSDDAARIEPPSQRMKCADLGEAHRSSFFDEAGFPTGSDWDEIDFPNLDDPHAYALEIHGDQLAPTYRDGDLLIVSPRASIRRHDRVLVRTLESQILVGLLARRTAQRIEILLFSGQQDSVRLSVGEVDWLARIVWVSQ